MAGGIERFEFTRASVDTAVCPPGKQQALYRDTREPALMLRVTAAGARAFVFEKRLAGKTVRLTIGPASMQIRAAKDRRGKPVTAGADVEAARLSAMVAQGIDPRIEKAEKVAFEAGKREAARRERAKLELSGLEAWTAYIEARRSKWGERTYRDHCSMVAEGGKPRKRSVAKTVEGPLRSLLDRPLARIDAETIGDWLRDETESRPTRAALAFRLLRAFVNWCAESPDFREIVCVDAHKARAVREELAKPGRKDDALQREQLRAWFGEVRKESPVMAAYLQTVLLLGCRPGEARDMRWDDIDFVWRSVTVRDKVEGERTIPLPPYLASVLLDLRARQFAMPAVPRRIAQVPEQRDAFIEGWRPSPFVFGTRHAEGGRIADGRAAHIRALKRAALPHVSLHGLRRSFATLSEWCEAPEGAVAQIQGHKPSATRERHYKSRPLDLLRVWSTRIEAWMLEQANIEQPQAETSVPALGVLKGGSGAD